MLELWRLHLKLIFIGFSLKLLKRTEFQSSVVKLQFSTAEDKKRLLIFFQNEKLNCHNMINSMSSHERFRILSSKSEPTNCQMAHREFYFSPRPTLKSLHFWVFSHFHFETNHTVTIYPVTTDQSFKDMKMESSSLFGGLRKSIGENSASRGVPEVHNSPPLLHHRDPQWHPLSCRVTMTSSSSSSSSLHIMQRLLKTHKELQRLWKHFWLRLGPSRSTRRTPTPNRSSTCNNTQRKIVPDWKKTGGTAAPLNAQVSVWNYGNKWSGLLSVLDGLSTENRNTAVLPARDCQGVCL